MSDNNSLKVKVKDLKAQISLLEEQRSQNEKLQ